MSGVDSLGDSGRALWDAVHKVREVGAEFVPLLLNACRVSDNLERISAELAESGLTVKLYDKQGNEINEVANPRLVEHRMQLQALRAVLASLGVDKLPVAVEDGPSFNEKLAAAKAAMDAAPALTVVK